MKNHEKVMSVRETARLAELEKTIARGQKTFVDVGLALAEIRDLRLYKREYGSFNEYCQKKWGWTRQHAYRLIEAAPVAKCNLQVTSQNAAIELARVAPSQRDGVIQAVVNDGKPLTAEEIKRHLPPPPPPLSGGKGASSYAKASTFANPTSPRGLRWTGASSCAKASEDRMEDRMEDGMEDREDGGQRTGGAAREGEGARAPTRPPAPAGEGARAPVRDKIGRAIPECCLEIWQRAQEAQDHLTALSRIRGALRKAQDDQDRLYAEINFSGAMSYLDQAYTELKTALPYTVCPSCQGHLAKTCRLCKGRGMISEYRWERCVPEETKRLVMRGMKAET